MRNIKLLVLLLASLHLPFSHAAQESQIQDEPFVIVPFDQFLDETVTNHQNIDEIFTFLHEQGCINTSFRQFLLARLNRDDVEDDVENDANFGEVLGKAQDLITQNMQNRFISTLDAAMKEQKALNQFHDPIFLYAVQHKDDSMRDVVHNWLLEWSKIKDYSGRTPLHMAVIDNHTEIARLLIGAGANLNLQNRRGQTPLHQAVIYDDIEIARLLIAKGADINLQDIDGDTLLHLVPFHDRTEIARLLIDVGINLNLQNRLGQTPLHLAVIDNHTEIARLLIGAGTDVNIQDNAGRTPLHWAAYYDRPEVVCLFIDAGADFNLLNNDGNTAKQLVCTIRMKIIFVRAGIRNAASCCIIS